MHLQLAGTEGIKAQLPLGVRLATKRVTLKGFIPHKVSVLLAQGENLDSELYDWRKFPDSPWARACSVNMRQDWSVAGAGWFVHAFSKAVLNQLDTFWDN